MNEGSKKKFMTAIFGEDGTQVDTATAAALLAATCSGGNIFGKVSSKISQKKCSLTTKRPHPSFVKYFLFIKLLEGGVSNPVNGHIP